MGVYKLEPACKDYLWGGNRLRENFHIQDEKNPLAEAWILSCHKDGESMLVLSPFERVSLPAFLRKNPSFSGSLAEKFPVFPVLIKLIDAKLPLSVQVHPDDSYAEKREGGLGKTEMWLILEREEGAFLYYGFKKEYTKEEVRAAIEGQYLTDYLEKVPVEKGDVFFIPAGTVHAIGAGIVIAEIQENSNLTYRVYDYGRKDKNGKERELHIAKALDVMHCKPAVRGSAVDEERALNEGALANEGNSANEEKREKGGSAANRPEISGGFRRLASCPYFTVDRAFLREGEKLIKSVGKESFLSAILLNGKGKVQEEAGGQELYAEKGNSFFIPAESGNVSFFGEGEWLFTYLSENPEKAEFRIKDR